jgi:hypothetical protein
MKIQLKFKCGQERKWQYILVSYRSFIFSKPSGKKFMQRRNSESKANFFPFKLIESTKFKTVFRRIES